MPGLCKYSKIFGEPKIGAHANRIGNIAVVDLGLTVIATLIITKYKYSTINIKTFTKVFVILLLVGIILHELFCVNTRLNSLIFGRKF